MIGGLKNIPKIPELQKRIAFTFLLLAVYRVGAHVPTPGIEVPRAITEDHEGSLWVASSGDGIARLRPTPFLSLFPAGESPLDAARAITLAAEGRLWATIQSRGLVCRERDGRETAYQLGIRIVTA